MALEDSWQKAAREVSNRSMDGMGKMETKRKDEHEGNAAFNEKPVDELKQLNMTEAQDKISISGKANGVRVRVERTGKYGEYHYSAAVVDEQKQMWEGASEEHAEILFDDLYTAVQERDRIDNRAIDDVHREINAMDEKYKTNVIPLLQKVLGTKVRIVDTDDQKEKAA